MFLNPNYSDAECVPLGLPRGSPRPPGHSSWVDFQDAYPRSGNVRYTVDRTLAEVILAHPEY